MKNIKFFLGFKQEYKLACYLFSLKERKTMPDTFSGGNIYQQKQTTWLTSTNTSTSTSKELVKISESPTAELKASSSN